MNSHSDNDGVTDIVQPHSITRLEAYEHQKVSFPAHRPIIIIQDLYIYTRIYGT